MSLAVIWHDVECGGYGEDLPLWRRLAAAQDGPVLDVGAGTGRVSLDLAAAGVAVTALDLEPQLLEELRERAAKAGVAVDTVVGDARDFRAGEAAFSLIIVPMQTLQLLGGPSGRAAFLRCALDHLEPGGRLAVALADAMDCFDEEHDMPPPPDACEIAGVRYASHLTSVVEEDGRAAIHRRREVIGPGERFESVEAVVRLDRVRVDEVAAEATQLGFLAEPCLSIPETEEYLGSAVVVLRAPVVPGYASRPAQTVTRSSGRPTFVATSHAA
jgi:SAM-dependent methyltransferase